jgi:Holliday junction resolvasome RuvABC endonuclease subunit
VTEFVWAVDPAVARLAFAFASLGSPTIEVETLTTACDAREGERLGLLDRQVRIYAAQAAGRWPPAVVWIEQASGKFQQPQLLYAIGVTQAALFETLGCPVWTIPSGKWKKTALGVGNATKPQIAAWVAERDDRPATQDEADAYAIAFAGREMFVQRRWEVTR